MANSTKESVPSQAPLTLRSDGRYQKKYRGKVYYLGRSESTALEEWQRILPYLEEGRKPPPKPKDNEITTDVVSVEYLVNAFLQHRHQQVEAGELSPRSLDDYKFVAREILEALGRKTPVDELEHHDFANLRKRLGKGRSLVTLSNLITRTKAIMNFASKHDLVERKIRGLAALQKPSLKSIRQERNKLEEERGKKLFSQEEIHALLAKASPQFKAFILLAVNCGLGNKDIAEMRPVHLDGNHLKYPRPKTAVRRESILWDETVQAIKDAGGLPFRTRCGAKWVDEDSSDNAVSKEFAKLKKACGIDRRGVSFYALRHVFETVASQTRDQVAVNYCMGHDDGSMAEVYRHGIQISRLQEIADHVHRWLFQAANN